MATKSTKKDRTLTEQQVAKLLPGLEKEQGVTVSYFENWSLVKKAPATAPYAGRKVIIVRKDKKVVANVFKTEEGEKLNAYFPEKQQLKSYSTKHTQVNAIRYAVRNTMPAENEAVLAGF